MIDSLEGLKNSIIRITEQPDHGGMHGIPIRRAKIMLIPNPHGSMYCPRCGDMRKMKVNKIFPEYQENEFEQIGIVLITKTTEQDKYLESVIKAVNNKLTPSLWKYECLQCNTTFTALIYDGPNGQELSVFSRSNGGLTTPNTPKSVAYYLDQAYRSQTVNATSAAMAMYRSALEHILYEQGFKNGMLASKIKDLEAAIQKGIAPKWAMELETEYLIYIKDLGNGAIHANGGSVEQQQLIDSEFLFRVTEVFRMLLFVIYELDSKKKSMLESFRSTASALNNLKK